MNKYILKAVMCSALVAPVLTSCELDQYPDTALVTEQAWQKMSDADNFNNGILAYFRSLSDGATSVSEVQADLFDLRNTAIDYNQVYSWTYTNAQFDGDGLWSNSYTAIANANNVINNISKVKVDGENEQKILDHYKGNAFLLRAYALSNMAPRYCKEYVDDENAKNVAGLPLLTEVDVNKKPARATLYDTYQFIMNDLQQARQLMNDYDNTDYATLSANVAEALEARVLLRMGKYQAALDSVSDLLSRYSLTTDADKYAEMWKNDISDFGVELIYEPQMTPDDRGSFYGQYESYIDDTGYWNPNYIPTQGLIDLYDVDDIRLMDFFRAYNDDENGEPDYNNPVKISCGDIITEGVVLKKFPGNASLKKGSDGTVFYNMPKPFRVAELYLIAAEASYKLNGTDGDYLKTLRAARGLNTTLPTGAPLFSMIKDEWTREFVGENFRLDNLKRWGDGFTRMAPQELEAGSFSNTCPVTNFAIQPDNQRWVWEIPSQELQANSNIERNWKREN